MRTRTNDTDPWDNFSHTTNRRPETQQVLAALQAFQEMFGQLPHKELVKLGWLESPSDPIPLTRVFFDLLGGQHPVLFRKNAKADDSLVAVWLSRVRSQAERQALEDRVPPFAGLEKDALRKLTQLSTDVGRLQALRGILATRGIVLVIVPGLFRMKLDGAVFRMSSGHAVVAMSLRYSRLDNFWFTLLHELAHLVLHWNDLDQPVLVDVEDRELEVTEKSANRLAKDAIVERSAWRNCAPRYKPGDHAVLQSFAKKSRVHPALVAGLLRRELNRYTVYSDIVNEHDVRELLLSYD